MTSMLLGFAEKMSARTVKRVQDKMAKLEYDKPWSRKRRLW
jgi:hypothetical protein